MSAEVIAADQGSMPSEAQPMAGYGYSGHGMHGGSGYSSYNQPISEEKYTAAQYGSAGAGDATMNIMLMSVLAGYAFFTMLMMMTFCIGPRSRGFYRIDIETVPEAQQQMLKNSFVADLEPMWRKAFIGKVYSLLVIQIFITMAVSFVMMQYGGYDFYVWTLTEGAWTRGTSFIAVFALIISLMCLKNKFPLNLVLLLSFTLAMSYTIGMITTAYAAMGMQVIVIEAFAITSLLFIALTAFTIWSKIDFSFLGAILPVCLFALIIWGFFSAFAFPSFAFRQVYALAGTLIFSLYVLYDTHMITTYLSFDDYVLGAINLYLDFINLFIMILQLLTGGRRD